VEVLGIVLSLIFGWLLGQSTGIVDRYFARRQALNRLLAEILEIRHRFKSTFHAVRAVKEIPEIPKSMYGQLFSSLPSEISWDDNISKRYNDAIDGLAVHEPVIAFDLRSKDIVGIISKTSLSNFGTTDKSAQTSMEFLETFEKHLVPMLDDTVLSVAALLGRSQLRWAESYLKESVELSDKQKAYFSSLQATISRAITGVSGRADG